MSSRPLKLAFFIGILCRRVGPDWFTRFGVVHEQCHAQDVIRRHEQGVDLCPWWEGSFCRIFFTVDKSPVRCLEQLSLSLGRKVPQLIEACSEDDICHQREDIPMDCDSSDRAVCIVNCSRSILVLQDFEVERSSQHSSVPVDKSQGQGKSDCVVGPQVDRIWLSVKHERDHAHVESRDCRSPKHCWISAAPCGVDRGVEVLSRGRRLMLSQGKCGAVRVSYIVTILSFVLRPLICAGCSCIRDPCTALRIDNWGGRCFTTSPPPELHILR